MTKLSALLALALVTTPLAIQEPARAREAPPDLAGTYTVEGTTGQGRYHGEALIQQRGRTVFVIWRMGNGRELAGLGLITGSLLAASYALDSGVGAIAVYQIEGARLVGEWPDGETIHTEILTKQGTQRAAEGQ